MPTSEERLTVLERTTQEYRPILQNFAYELSMVKGLIVEQTGITQELGQDINDVKKQLAHVEQKLNQLETKIDEHTALLIQILTRLPENPQ